jgi:hypothetical protein
MPGIGLLLFRISVATAFLVDGTASWTLVTSWWILILFIVPAAELCLGFLTPCCASLCCLVEFGVLWITGGQNEFHLVIALVSSAVLAMLGPGAYSLDARIFGRRLLSVPLRNEP